MIKTLSQQAKLRWLIFSAILVSLLEFFTFFNIAIPFGPALVIYSLVILAVGYDTLLKGVRALFKLNFKSINLLMLIAVLGAFFLGEFEEAAVVIVLFSLAEHLEDTGIAKSKSAFDTLMKQMPEKVLLKQSGQLVDVQSVSKGQVMIIKPGQVIPLDGQVIAGASFVDESTITGEPIPQDKRPGDAVFAGTLNSQGALEVEVTQTFQNTAIAKIKEMAFHASDYKAETQRFIEQFSSIYTPVVMLIALLLLIVPTVFLQTPFHANLYYALSLLVIACPCALVISTPIAIFSAIGNASQKGILIKGGKFLEAIGQVAALALDKTRTLTLGKPFVSDLITFGKNSKENLLACAAGIERLSEHPLAESIVNAAQEQNLAIHEVENFEGFMGKGARADCLVCYDKHHCIGKLQFILEEHTVPNRVVDEVERLQEEGKSVIVVSTHQEVEGIIALQDKIRPESKEFVNQLKRLGITPVMLTGDHESAAHAVASALGIAEVRAELLPQDKVLCVQELAKQYSVVGMVGDGINDAPALAAASVGITLAKLGSDLAMEAASIVLLNDQLLLIPYLIRLGKKTLRMIQFNTFFAIAVKCVFIFLALVGKTNLALAILADVGVTLLVILNSLRLRGQR